MSRRTQHFVIHSKHRFRNTTVAPTQHNDNNFNPYFPSTAMYSRHNEFERMLQRVMLCTQQPTIIDLVHRMMPDMLPEDRDIESMKHNRRIPRVYIFTADRCAITTENDHVLCSMNTRSKCCEAQFSKIPSDAALLLFSPTQHKQDRKSTRLNSSHWE